MNVAIVGAGLAGLAAAGQLRQQRPELTITVWEKSHGVGGRAATRRAHGATFDHGAQYVKGATQAIEQLLREELPHETLVDIARPVWTFDHTGRIQEGDPAQNREAKWTYSDGLTRLSKELAQGLDLRLDARVHHVEHDQSGYRLVDAQGRVMDQVDRVLLTPPAPQTHDLIAASTLPDLPKAALLSELAKVTYRPCLTVTLGYRQMIQECPFYALVNSDRQHPITWLAYEHLKPDRNTGNQAVLIAQMAPSWSQSHWDAPLAAITLEVATLVSGLLDEALHAPSWSDRQGWRYALPDGICDFHVLNTVLPGLYFAGDFTAGQGRVHLAVEQGWRVAERILQDLP